MCSSGLGTPRPAMTRASGGHYFLGTRITVAFGPLQRLRAELSPDVVPPKRPAPVPPIRCPGCPG